MLDFSFKSPKVKELVIASNNLKAYQNKLSESDYKIIKCYEYSMAGLELPYDINALHAEREQLREEIRKLEEILA